MDTQRQKLLSLVEDKGLSLRSLSVRLGRNAAYLHQFIHKGTPRSLRQNERAALAEMIGVAPSVLMTDEQRDTVQWALQQTSAPAQQTAAALPIVGYAQGGADVMVIDREKPMGTITRPAILDGVTDAYAIEIVGEAYSPRLKSGETAYVHPNKALVPSCDCVVELDDGSGIVGEYIKMDADRLYVRVLNPDEKREYLRANVRACHRIMGAAFSR